MGSQKTGGNDFLSPMRPSGRNPHYGGKHALPGVGKETHWSRGASCFPWEPFSGCLQEPRICTTYEHCQEPRGEAHTLLYMDSCSVLLPRSLLGEVTVLGAWPWGFAFLPPSAFPSNWKERAGLRRETPGCSRPPSSPAPLLLLLLPIPPQPQLLPWVFQKLK